MLYKVEIDIMPQKALLDPQGKTVNAHLSDIGVEGAQSTRIGKHIEIEIEGKDKTEVESKVKIACDNLLVNKIMEEYTFTIKEI